SLVGGVGERRIEMLAITADTAQHSIHELDLAPAADAVLRVRRDVRGTEGSECRVEGKAAAETSLILLTRRGMARRAPTGIEHGLAVGEVRRPRCQLRLRKH